ncbi:MAG: MerR family transcriptional regulator [Thermomicrobiales bacterium]|nr:MerR family transcriptional regulator [Thermomicrobiales bacterium]MCO5219168.1 MerR family transcriptional regulator [Thermomicrobiales bacterium]MCO5228074.1 MerR family transcriptional regulator [Thermomicrobiales bacterium]
MAEYPISEAARLSGLPATAIRYYESIGLLEPAGRDASSGHRVYTDADLVTLEAVACLHATGLSIPAMRNYLQNSRRGMEGAAMQIELLHAQAEQLEREGEYLELRRRYVELKTRFWEAKLAENDAVAEELAGKASAMATRLADGVRRLK